MRNGQPQAGSVRPALLAIALAASSVVSCGNDSKGSQPLTPVDQVGQSLAAAWIDDDTLVIEKNDQDPIAIEHATADQLGYSLWTMQSDGADLARLTPEKAPGCRIVDYRFPTRLPNGAIGAVRTCRGELASDDDTSDYVSLDPKTGSETVLAPLSPAGTCPVFEGLPIPDFNPNVVTWAPDMSYAVIVAGGCSRLGLLDQDGVKPFDASLPDGRRLDEGLLGPGFGPCESDIEVRGLHPPDGRTLAVAVAPDASGDATSRRNASWSLYLLDAGGTARKLASGNRSCGSISWAPDGGSLLVTRGTSDGECELGLVDPDDGVFTALASGVGGGGASLSPDGRRGRRIGHPSRRRR